AVEQRGQAPTPTLPRLLPNPPPRTGEGRVGAKRGREFRHARGGWEGACDLLGSERLDGEDREDHVLDAEAGVDRVELRGEQPGQMARVAVRPGGAERDMLDPAVDAVKGEVETARPDPLARQARHQIRDQPLDGASEIGGV